MAETWLFIKNRNLLDILEAEKSKQGGASVRQGHRIPRLKVEAVDLGLCVTVRVRLWTIISKLGLKGW